MPQPPVKCKNPMAGASSFEKAVFQAAQPSYPTVEDVVLRSGMNPSTVRKCLARLEARSVVQRIEGRPQRWKVVWNG